jgi:hypothetical protein
MILNAVPATICPVIVQVAEPPIESALPAKETTQMTQNRNLFSMLSPFKKAERHDGPNAENSPEVEARRKLDLRIEQALADQLLALTIEAPASENVPFAADFYTPMEPVSVPSYLDKYSIA